MRSEVKGSAAPIAASEVSDETRHVHPLLLWTGAHRASEPKCPDNSRGILTKVVPEVELDAQHLHHQDRHQWTVVLRPLPNAKLSLLHSSLSYEPTANVASTRLQRLDQELNLRHLHMTRSRGSLTARSGVTRSATTQKSANSGTRIPERSWPRLRIAARCLPIPEFSG